MSENICVVHNSPACVKCFEEMYTIKAERDRLKAVAIGAEARSEKWRVENVRLKVEVEAITHNCFCNEKVMEENRRLSKEWDQVHDLNNQYVAERFKLKAKAEKLAEVLKQIKSVLGPLPTPSCCEGAQVEMEIAFNLAKAALEGEGK